MLFLAGALGFFQYPVARATADGPDFFRVHGIATGSALTTLAEPRAGVPAIGSAPSNAVCLRNRGCRGGRTFEEFNTLDDEAKRQRAAANPRWCQVEYQGRTGWVDARHLTEAPCPMADARPQSDARTVAFARDATRSVIKGRLSGRKSIDYLVRAAARRNEHSRFTLSAGLSGPAMPPVSAKADALIPGTPCHAQATIKCEPAYSRIRSCEAFVTRRDFAGTATVEVCWDETRRPNILSVKGKPTVVDVPVPMLFTKDAQGNYTIDVDGQDRFEIPEARIFGG